MTDILILNTAAVDVRRPDFDFATKLVGPGGLAKCQTKDMPAYAPDQLRRWIADGCATAGGPGNCAPLLARAGAATAVGANLGRGDDDGLDPAGRFFYDQMTTHRIDMSAIYVHPDLPTGITFIHDTGAAERGGLAYFPNANNDFDFERFRPVVERLKPAIVYYMYSGLSDRGDANNGKDLAQFVKWCKTQNAVTIVDSATLTADPPGLIASGNPVPEYQLLKPLLGELDIFFTSSDEAKLIANTLTAPRRWSDFPEHDNNIHFLEFILSQFGQPTGRTRLFGVTVGDGAYHAAVAPDRTVTSPTKTTSKFMAGGAIDLVGAGDSFRAGLLTYISHNLQQFNHATLDFSNAVQMGNLFAAAYVKAPLNDRYANIKPYPKMLQMVNSNTEYHTLDDFYAALNA